MVVVLIIAGALFGVFAIWRLAFLLRATRIPATVVQIEMGGEDNDTPMPILEYDHPAGDRRRLQPTWHSSLYSRTQVGDRMTVYVAGDKAKLGTFSELWFFQVVLAVVLTGIAISFVVFSR